MYGTVGLFALRNRLLSAAGSRTLAFGCMRYGRPTLATTALLFNIITVKYWQCGSGRERGPKISGSAHFLKDTMGRGAQNFNFWP